MPINKLTNIDNWPDRKMPQERFDEKVQIAMEQMSNMVDELNTSIIPILENITEISNDINELRTNIQNINNTLSDKANNIIMTGSTSTSDGISGLVPPPSSGNPDKYLRNDGQWVTPPDTTYLPATSSTDGLLSSSDKTKLDSIESNAQRNPALASSTYNGVMSKEDKSKLDQYPIKNNSTTQYLRGDGQWVTPPDCTSSLNSHTSNQDNPHNVTKTQIGLSNLPNAKSDSTNLDDSNTLATSKAVKTLNDSKLNNNGRWSAFEDRLMLKHPTYAYRSASCYNGMGLHFIDKNDLTVGSFFYYDVPNVTQVCMNHGNSVTWGRLGIRIDNNNYLSSECPTTPSDATNNQIVTVNYALNKFPIKVNYPTIYVGNVTGASDTSDLYNGRGFSRDKPFQTLDAALNFLDNNFYNSNRTITIRLLSDQNINRYFDSGNDYYITSDSSYKYAMFINPTFTIFKGKVKLENLRIGLPSNVQSSLHVESEGYIASLVLQNVEIYSNYSNNDTVIKVIGSTSHLLIKNRCLVSGSSNKFLVMINRAYAIMFNNDNSYLTINNGNYDTLFEVLRGSTLEIITWTDGNAAVRRHYNLWGCSNLFTVDSIKITASNPSSNYIGAGCTVF